MFATLTGGETFTKLDLRHAYAQVPLDDMSKVYTTINTPLGLFRYNRMPFGVSSAPSCFQRIIEGTLQGIPHTLARVDDILVGERVDASGRRAVEVIICMITRDFSVISMTSKASLSLSLYYCNSGNFRKRLIFVLFVNSWNL